MRIGPLSWKRKLALGFAALLALLVLFFVVEHFRGTWGLVRWKSRMAAKGEPLTIGAAMPAPVPANEDGMPALLSAAAQVGPFQNGLPAVTQERTSLGMR
jgi:hypothetical protein